MPNQVMIKICGLTDSENLLEIAALNPDYVGFIFTERSPRFVKLSPELTQTLSKLNNTIRKIGVFLNHSISEIIEITSRLSLHGVQLHGDEDENFCASLRSNLPNIQIIKSFAIEEAFRFESTNRFENSVDIFLFDTKSLASGGSGKKFNWNLLSHYKGSTPVLLSGGLGVEDIEAIRTLPTLYPFLVGVDANSRLEITPGIKSIPLVEKFINGVRA